MASRAPRMPSMKKLEKLLGVSFSPDAIKEIKRAPLPRNQGLTHSLMAEATINSLAYPEKVKQVDKICKNCEQPFYTSYRYVSYCSDECRRITLAKQYGIDWVEEQYHGRNEIQVWGGRVPPAIIPPEALSVMKYLVEKAEASLGHSIQPWHAPLPKKAVSSAPAPIPIEPAVPKDIDSLLDSLQDIPKLPSLAELLKDLDLA
jgi:hypothetical protein